MKRNATRYLDTLGAVAFDRALLELAGVAVAFTVVVTVAIGAIRAGHMLADVFSSMP